MSAHRKPKEAGHHSEQLDRVLALLRTGRDEQQREQPKSQARNRYEAILKHHSDGVVARELFEDSDDAKRWLFRRWAELNIPQGVVDSHCAAAIYDRHDYSVKRIFAMGDLHLLLED